MKIISLWQPWASLLAYGYKAIETRSWPANYTGPLAIHAAKKWNQDLRALCLQEPFFSCLKEMGYQDGDSLPRGCVVARCNLVKCIPTERVLTAWLARSMGHYGSELAFGDYTRGRFAWILSRIERLKEPTPERGHQGFWEWTEPDSLPGESRWIKVLDLGEREAGVEVKRLPLFQLLEE